MAKGKIVRVAFEDRVMLFGNSYKPWNMQFDEYISTCKRDGIELVLMSVYVSDSQWISWGGLKWCPEQHFQQQLNREGCQESDPDNLHPRKYDDMKFYYDDKIYKQVRETIF